MLGIYIGQEILKAVHPPSPPYLPVISLSMPPFDITAAQIVGLFMESVFYGIYLVTFFSTMRVLLWKDGAVKPFKIINKPMVVAALFMLLFGTMDVGFGLRHNLDAFVYSVGKQTPAAQFAHISYWVNVMKFADYSAQTFIGDGILLYRCYIIYNRRWFVIVGPALMWIGTAVCSSFTIYIEARLDTGVLSQSQLKPFITSTLVLTLATNVITTSLIVYRIWTVKRRTSKERTSIGPYSRILRVLIECGAIYTTSIVILFVCYLANNNAILGVSDSVVQIIGITFNLLILSVDRGTITYAQSNQASYSNYVNTVRSEIDTRQHSVPLHLISVKTMTVRDPPETDSVEKEGQENELDREPGRSKLGEWADRKSVV